MTRIVCTGDLHLGAHPEYGRAPGERLATQQQVWRETVTLALERDADLLLFAGDAFDGPGIPPEQLAVFADGVKHAHDNGLPVLAITGNGKHDAAMRDVNGLQIFEHVPGITVHSQPGLYTLDGLVVATMPWVHPGRLVAKHGGGDRDDINQQAAGLLVEIARGLHDAARTIPGGRPVALCLHGSVSGAQTPDGALTDLFREPVIDAWQLEQVGFDAIICGHIHAPQQLSDETPFFYVGSPLPLNFGEADCAHGVTVLDLDPAGALVNLEFVEISSPRFVTFEYDGAQMQEWSDAIHEDAATDPDLLDAALVGAVVRLKYSATRDQQRSIDIHAIRRAVLDAGAAVVKVSAEIVREDRARVDGVDETIAPLAALDRWIGQADLDDELADGMRARTARYLEQAA